MEILNLFLNCILAAAGMFWAILWALILGFALSGVIMIFAPKKRIASLIGRAGPKELALAMIFGAASSSCSYAAAAMTRSLFQKGAHIISALAFLLASTNLVVELSFVLGILMGWPFVAAEFLGGVLLVLVMATLMKIFGPIRDFDAKRAELAAQLPNSVDSIDEVADPKTIEAWRRVAQAFVSEWKMIWKDVLLGVTISGFLMVLVPDHFWKSLFLQTDADSGSVLKLVENAAIEPIVSMLSFVCSVGNIPMANVLYRGGIGFGGALSFIYADLIIIPIILVYKRYFGWRLALWISGIFYVSMFLAGILVDLLFRALDWVPKPSTMMEMKPEQLFAVNYTFWLNLGFTLLAFLLLRLSKSGPEDDAGKMSCCHG